jgi:ABC-type multidrug transport system permease subunit
LQIVSAIVVVAGIIDHFSPFGFPKWAIYLGIACYFIGALCGMKITWFSQRR